MNTIRDILLQIHVLCLISSFRQQWAESDVTVHMKMAVFYLNYASLQAQEAFLDTKQRSIRSPFVVLMLDLLLYFGFLF